MDRDTAEPRVGPIPGERARRWVEYHHRFAAPSTHVYEFVWNTGADAAGPFCTDVDGNVLLDFAGHVAAAPLGYNNPHLLERLREFDPVDPAKIAGQDFYVSGDYPPEESALPGPTELMARLVDLTDHLGMDTVFCSNSGAEAVENAIKICYASGGHRAITTEGAFHGRTLGALSLNRSKTAHRKGYPEIPGVVTVPYPSTDHEYESRWRTDGPGGNVLADRLDPERGVIDPSEVAYLIVEPVQGEGGYRVAHPEFVRDLSEIRERFDVRIVVDEIQSGLGRTGEWWGVDHFDLTPDVLACAKGLRVGATAAREELFSAEQGRLSSTWGGGDVIASLQGALTIDVIRERNLLANARERGRQLREHLEDAAPAGVTDVRGLGLMTGVEFVTKERRQAVIEAAFERGLLTVGCGHETIRLLPPLDVTEREIELGAEVFLEAVEDAAGG